MVAFRNSGHIAACEKWCYDGVKAEIVNQYKYLEVNFPTELTFSYCLKDMASRAKKKKERERERERDLQQHCHYCQRDMFLSWDCIFLAR